MTEFFLQVSLDQVTFMEGLMQPDGLRVRIQIWAEEEMRRGRLPARSDDVLRALLDRCGLSRGEVVEVVRTGDRQARRITAALLERGVLESEGPRAALRLSFPASLAHRWMPGLFPEKVG